MLCLQPVADFPIDYAEETYTEALKDLPLPVGSEGRISARLCSSVDEQDSGANEPSESGESCEPRDSLRVPIASQVWVDSIPRQT